jgi:hypothetical protein
MNVNLIMYICWSPPRHSAPVLLFYLTEETGETVLKVRQRILVAKYLYQQRN